MDPSGFVATTEFEQQACLWLTWNDEGFLGGPPMSETLLALMRAVCAHVPIRLLYNEWTSWQEQLQRPEPPRSIETARRDIEDRLARAGVDLQCVSFARTPFLFGAIQDPGPSFLRREPEELAITGFDTRHPLPLVRDLAAILVADLGAPIFRSDLVCDGGNRQTDGAGTLMLGGAFARSMNPGRSEVEMEAEYRRVLGVDRVIWLGHGPREEDTGRLEDGRWGIGTGGHVDQFARFADERTVLLAEVPEDDLALGPVTRHTHRRMQENLRILEQARDAEGRPLRILRMPTALPLTAKVRFDALDAFERHWFEGAQPGEDLEFYLPDSYLNFVLANGTVVTASYWREGLPETVRERDEAGRGALQAAFPERTVVQVDATALLYDGAGLHCYTRNQPHAARRA